MRTPADDGIAAARADAQRAAEEAQQQSAGKPLYVPPHLARYVDWDIIGRKQAELAYDLMVMRHDDGGLTFRFYWPVR